MPIRIAEIDHVVLRVKDLERAMRFYVDVLGCVEERELPELGLFQLRAGRGLVDLVAVDSPLGQAGGPAAGATARNMDHFCLRLDPFDESEIRAELARHGIEADATSSRYGAQGMGPSIYLTDPDDNVVELKGPGEPS